MSEKKYPYIGDNRSGQIVLIYGKDSAFHISGQYQGEFSDAYSETGVRNITREYLANTYGKCESQEHADFICKLAENAGFRTSNDYDENLQWFCSSNYRVAFYEEFVSKSDGEKLIHLPLPPKEKEMPEVKSEKPIYTKEMHERGEKPTIGAKVKYPSGEGVIVVSKPDESGVIIVLDSHCNEYKRVSLAGIEPIPTIEDDLKELAADYFEGGYKHHCYQLVSELLTKYNITPKGE